MKNKHKKYCYIVTGIILILFLVTGCGNDDQYYIDLLMKENNFTDEDKLSCQVDDYGNNQVKVTCNYVVPSANCGYKHTDTGVIWDCTNQGDSVRTISEVYNKDGTKPSYTKPVPNKNVETDKLIQEINFNEFKKIVNGDKYNIVCLSQPNCSYCTSFKNKLSKVLKDNNLFSYELNISNLYSAQRNELLELLKLYVDDSLGTPTTIIVGGGSVIGARIGDVSEDSIIDFLENYSFID